MKIDTDLRLALKAAEKAQPQDTREARDAAAKAAIAELFKAKPLIARDAKRLAAKLKKANETADASRKALCEKYGLRRDDEGFAFANCDNGKGRFEKIGGKIPRQTNWKLDAIMRELALATPKEGATILKRLGIKWE